MSIDELLLASGVRTSEQPPPSAPGQPRKLYLHAGQLYATADPTEIITILGSCVSICIYDLRRRVGGLNHFMLPQDVSTAQANPRYVRQATDMLVQELLALGASRTRLQAKVFGGASILTDQAARAYDLGHMNVEAARRKLSSDQIPVVCEDVGGSRGRKLLFQTWDGTALVKQV